MMVDTDFDTLDTLLDKFKCNTKYDIDGIIIHTDEIYNRNTSGNPDYAFAFKKIPKVK